MPALPNPRHKIFAQARASGALLDDARFAQARGHGSRLAKRSEVAARIAELKAARAALLKAHRLMGEKAKRRGLERRMEL